MMAVRERLQQAARAGNATVLIEGETGVGKELAARCLHESGGSPTEPFVAVNCASLNETLLEAELFGHERGAFTGALVGGKPGLFEAAGSGTILLDEIGELSLSLQAKLLRVLEERTLRRVGGHESVPLAARIVAATNRALGRAVATGEFRRDLYYRLAVVTVRIPPLRERREDVAMLAWWFLEQLGSQRVPPLREFSDDALEALAAHPWPGNVRELRNAIHRAVLFGRGEAIRASDLELESALDSTGSSMAPPARDANRTLRSVEAEQVRAALGNAGGNVTRAAAMLGIHRSTLYQKLRHHRIELVRRGVVVPARESQEMGER
ncbi:MAG: sigma 54-interacting transcriptional regulator [Planctomycetes bacterium]|nr:sigma 54-interacting transcriptional regulator [Planctomycetota bacterium]MBI3843013.1 sigma 54-interacting transcriptional regulator [Planctomycetota bacterium]